MPIILKARQLGLTWLCLGFILWLLLFHGASTALLFSLRDTEATNLLDYRLKGMYQRLPKWMGKHDVLKDSMHHWELSNGSVAQAFPANAGDSYTGSIALIDEADLIPKLNRLLASVKPTIADGGRLILLSRSNKLKPNSTFKKIYRAARKDQNEYHPIFLPWTARPERDQAWYEQQVASSLSETGALDDVHEQYPATESEALSPPTLNKRVPIKWLDNCYEESAGIPLKAKADAPYLGFDLEDVPGLTLYLRPQGHKVYVCGADPAEGNPNSNDSSATWLDAGTGEEVATLCGKFEPATFAGYIARVCRAFNHAAVMPERNNHGHKLIYALELLEVLVLVGRDGRAGWLSSGPGKTMLYDEITAQVKTGDVVIHSMETYLQLSNIEAATLKAPEGERDDRADSIALAAVGRAPAVSTQDSEPETEPGPGWGDGPGW